jgi:hypothetical protein
MSALKKTPGYINVGTLWFERLMGLVVLANLLFVTFDWSYVKLRQFYLRSDLLIENNLRERPVEKYVNQVKTLKDVLETEGLNSPEAEKILENLRQQSQELFEDNPFRITDKYGSLQDIKNLLKEHLQTQDVNQGLQTFWTKEYLAENDWRKELRFFESEVSYLMVFYEPKLFYDPIKGIEPNRDTQEYLKKVDELKTELALKNNLNTPEVTNLLTELRQLSVAMIENDPFDRVNRSGNLEKIKYEIRGHIFSREPGNLPEFVKIQWLNSSIIWTLDWLAPEVLWEGTSSKGAFRTFWSVENLSNHGWEKELNFFDREIRFLMQSNYFRHLGADSNWLDRFWLLDLPWMALFFLEFIGRTWLLSRRKQIPWGMAIGERWYDLTLWLPVPIIWPGFRWLRVVPVIIRLDQTKFPDLEPLRNRLSMNLIASFAEELTQVVVIRAINQVQEAVQKGQFTRSLFDPTPQPKKTYIDINDTEEIPAIANRLLEVTVCQVLPTIQPELEAVIRYQIEKAMQNSPIYQRIHRLPGIGRFPDQLAEGIISQVTKLVTETPQDSYISSKNSIPDPIASELTERLVKKFTITMRTELQRKNTLDEIESLMSDFLEEVKLNYVQNLSEEEIQELLPVVKEPPQLTGG